MSTRETQASQDIRMAQGARTVLEMIRRIHRTTMDQAERVERLNAQNAVERTAEHQRLEKLHAQQQRAFERVHKLLNEAEARDQPALEAMLKR